MLLEAEGENLIKEKNFNETESWGAFGESKQKNGGGCCGLLKDE